ncbi:MAG TPA: serine/threonine-protein kinase [Fimbriiglobus sp.]|nr:serine/threonine-protein kinase [Fimbriiglobus sp.]
MPIPDARPTPPADDPSGEPTGCRSIGGYRLLRRIGEGAMSRVFLGYDAAGLRRVAVKLLADHLAGNKQFVNRFYREARMSRVLSHPNLIQGLAHGYDESARRHYLILEYVDGPTALALLNKLGSLPVGGVVRVGIEIGKALAHLHAQGYVHRDVKPDNILLGQDGSAKLADLGLAKRLAGDVELTTTNQGVGTPHYMPYEQAVNGDLVDGRSDQFALGATLYHLLTGRVPFAGETHEEIVREKAQNAYQPARDHRPDVPLELDRILARTLACDPRARYQSAAELVSELAATGLAADGPMWTPTPESLPGGSAPPDPDGGSRTRADLPIFGQPDLLAAPPPLPVARPPHVRPFGWPLMAVTFFAGLLGLASAHSLYRERRPDTPQPPPNPVGVTAKAPGSGIPGASQ